MRYGNPLRETHRPAYCQDRMNEDSKPVARMTNSQLAYRGLSAPDVVKISQRSILASCCNSASRGTISCSMINVMLYLFARSSCSNALGVSTVTSWPCRASSFASSVALWARGEFLEIERASTDQDVPFRIRHRFVNANIRAAP